MLLKIVKRYQIRLSQMIGAFNPLNLNLPITTDKIYYVNFTPGPYIYNNISIFLATHPFLFCDLAILK